MLRKKEFYGLSPEADQDISKIFDYTEREHCFERAGAYISQFEDLFGSF